MTPVLPENARDAAAPPAGRRRGAALARVVVCAALAALLSGCVPLGVRVQNMLVALLG